MGKAAENERIKLRATWFNNVSIGMFLAGIIVPSITAIGKTEEIKQFFRNWLQQGLPSTNRSTNTHEFIFALIPFVAAFVLSWRWSIRDLREIEKIKD